MSRQTATNPLEVHHSPTVSLTPQPPFIDPIQRTWDAVGHTNRTIFLHTFGIPCGLAANAWDELHYTVQIVLRAHFRRFIKSMQVRTC